METFGWTDAVYSAGISSCLPWAVGLGGSAPGRVGGV